MGALENKVLDLFYRGYTIESIENDLNLNEEDLADIIIDLDDRGFIILQDKKWIITEKGKEIFMKRDEELKKLKIDYLRGNINKEEFEARKKEIGIIPDNISVPYVDKSTDEHKYEEKEENKEEPKNINCPKCDTENRPESNFCRKCGTQLKKV